MAQKLGQGNFINGSFLNHGSITLTSENPSCHFQPVFSIKTDLDHVSEAVSSAKKAYKSWCYTSFEEKQAHLLSLKACFIKNEALMAQAISEEMGKIKSEALTEAKSLSARIDLMLTHGQDRVKTQKFYDLRAETRAHAQGVLAVLGPYNFPAHLMNAHVIPSLMLGNTVVIKPSEICPWVGEIYAQCLAESTLPKGVANLIHGRGDIGRALSLHQDIDGVLFTGSYQTGRALKEMLLDQPHKILALEMGGKNFAVIMDDADLEQALVEVINGAFLTTGQRCTATSRLLVHEKVFHRFKNALISVIKNLSPVPAHEAGMFGPLATKNALNKFMSGLIKAKEEGAEVLVESKELTGGAFVTPSLYQVKPNHPILGYLGEELFGPNLALESFNHLDQAIERINQSPYGLSNAIFTLDQNHSERLYFETKSGVLNINRSTNNAFGQMPFGGVNKSGNQRPAGIDAVRYASFPVAITSLPYGEPSSKAFKSELHDETPLSIITMRHALEKSFEAYGILSDNAALDRVAYSYASFDGLNDVAHEFFAKLKELFASAIKMEPVQFIIDVSLIDQALLLKLEAMLGGYFSALGLSFKAERSLRINVPPKLAIPRSRAMLDRLYKKEFVPAEKKSAVIDLNKSRGAYLVSVDDDPLILFDAASQIATMGTGFLADAYQNAYDAHQFDLAVLKNSDLAFNDDDAYGKDAELARKNFEQFIHEKSGNKFKSVSYGSSGAEANEIALDLCRQNGSQGTTILAFEGAFHGRTIMTLQATYNKEKRGPFAFSGYEAVFLPFPELKDPDSEPALPEGFLAELKKGLIPLVPKADPLLKSELEAFSALKEEAQKGNICAVIIEPMQCEGGDRYGSRRFFSGLRALTRALKIPLIFDEVQTGFNLGREFFWHQELKLVDENGQPDYPDCVTMAKKAQLGVCLSVWDNQKVYSPHVIQLKRGLIHGQSIKKEQALKAEAKAKKELNMLKEFYPDLVLSPRACGFAFAFDMPTKELASSLIDRRFNYGFMAYIAGEKTLRFRLNTVAKDEIINRLFEKLFIALADLRDQTSGDRHNNKVKPERFKNDWQISKLDAQNFAQYKNAIEIIENNTYEPGRRDTMEYLLDWLKVEDSAGIIIKDAEQEVAGYAIGGPLEHSTADGPKTDPHRGLNDTFYSANITVNEKMRGVGLGRILKQELIKEVAQIKGDKAPRYLFMNSRNHLGKTAAMSQINEELGAYLVSIYEQQYGGDSQSAYLRLPLQKKHPVKVPENTLLDCQNSLQSPFYQVPKSFLADLESDKLRSVLGSKLTLSNWATPAMVRYSELLRKVIPAHLNHAYFTSGRDEVVDKGLRSLRFHRLKADIAIGFSHQWLGQTTAAARSLSFDQGQPKPFSFFNWPKAIHPSIGKEQSLKDVQNLIDQHGPERILGLVVELMGEKSGFTFTDDYLLSLDSIRQKTGIPLVFVENTSGFFRSGKSLFLSDHLKVKADMVWWYTGGQLGHVLVGDQYFVSKPLTLISTWDGDELSMARSYHNLLHGSSIDLLPIKNFEEAMLKLKGCIHGQGTTFGLKLKDEASVEQAIAKGKKSGILLGRGFDHTVMIMAKPDFSPAQFDQVVALVTQIIER